MAAVRYCLIFLLTVFLLKNVYAIKGSTISQRGDFPYQADLIITFIASDTLFRTGSLISRNFILTTASNVFGSSTITVVLGVYNVEDKQDPNRRTYTGRYYIEHQMYNPQTGINNIALVKLNQPAEITDFINIIPIPRFFCICLPLIGRTARVSGWGTVTLQTPVEFQVLRYADIKIRSYKQCLSSFPNTNYKQLCGTHPTKYFEESDIGAPLVFDGTLVGIAADTSYVNGVESSPQVYTRVDVHLEWIGINSDVVILEK